MNVSFSSSHSRTQPNAVAPTATTSSFSPQQTPTTAVRMTRPVSLAGPTSVRKRISPPMPNTTKAMALLASTIFAVTAPTSAYMMNVLGCSSSGSVEALARVRG